MREFVTEPMHCPKCGLRYPDAAQRFCDNDGTRLVPDPTARGEARLGVFSSVLSPNAPGTAKAPALVDTEGEMVFEIDDDAIMSSEEVIRDEEMAELFRRQQAAIKPVPDRRAAQNEEVELELEPAYRDRSPSPKPAIQRVNPYEIPLGHVDLDERQSAPAHLNDFVANDPAAFVGKTVKGRYRVVEMLGEDDAGYAYIAEDRIMNDRRVVVRILAEFEGDEITADILAEERVRLSHFNHPSVARVFDSGAFTNGTKFLISEHPDGLTAEEILTIHGRFDPQRAARIIRNAGYALGDVHKQGILHRDIRPANIEIAAGEGDAMKIVNFGVSNGAPYPENLAYTAPEVIEGGISTAASDIYALGVTAHRLLTGEFPFMGDDARELVRDQRQGYESELPEELNEVFTRVFAPDPRARFTTAREFGDAFHAAAAAAGELGRTGPTDTDSASLPEAALEKASAVRTEKIIAVPPSADASPIEPAWKQRSPEPLAEPNAKWLKIALATFAVLTVVFAAAWIYLLQKPAAPVTSANVDANANSAYDPTETPPARRDIVPPPDSAFFDNNKAGLKGDLFRNFVAFSLFYPKSWTAIGPRESTDIRSRGKFLDLSRSTADGKLQEQLLVSYYASRGTYSDDSLAFANLVRESNQTLAKLIPGYQVVSEGPTSVNGWKAYELKFQGSGPVSNGERLIVWGRRLFVPAARPGVRNGFEITLLATSNSDEIQSVDELGSKGQLGEVLSTFEPGRNF